MCAIRTMTFCARWSWRTASRMSTSPALPWTEIDFPGRPRRARATLCFLPSSASHDIRPTSLRFFAGQRVLVTGASGFIGWHVADLLVQAGAQVRALVRPSTKRSAEAFEWVEGDLLRRETPR